MDLSVLIEKCLDNDRFAQRTLYENYKDSLYTIVYRLTNDRESASDLLQEAFIEAFKNLAKLKEPLYFHAWIKQILVRKAYRYLKTKKEEVSIDAVAEIGYQDHVDVGYIEKAIQTLPVKSRSVFVMAAIEGFAHKEIAETLNITVGTSKSQLNYAKTKLKEMLKSHLV